MNYRYVEDAELELIDATLYYEGERPGLGFDFEAEVLQSIRVILEAPKRWSVSAPGFRRYRLDRFPYRIVYRIVSPSMIEIAAVAHGKRRPGYWLRRV